MAAMLLCGLYAILYLTLFCIVMLVLWLIFSKLLAIMAPTLAIDVRVWQLLGLAIFLIFLIIVVQAFLSGGLCHTGRLF
jgi:hypothetical protein